MSPRPQTSPSGPNAPIDVLTDRTRGAAVGGRSFHEGFDDVDDTTATRSIGNNRQVAHRVLTELAAERADDASTSFLGATLLTVAAGAVALSSVQGPAWLPAVAASLFLAAIAVVFVVRTRLRRELIVVGRAHGLSEEEAKHEATQLLTKTLHLE